MDFRQVRRRLRRIWTRKGNFLRAVSIAAVSSLLVTFIFTFSFTSSIEQAELNFWFKRRGPVSTSGEIIIVGVDDESFEKLNLPGHAAWPRSALAELLEYLAADGAKGALLDFLFSGHSETQVDERVAHAFTLLPTVIGSVIEDVPETNGDERTYKRKQLLPETIFRSAAKEVVLFNIPIETDGSVRRFRSNVDPTWNIDKMPMVLALSALGRNLNELPEAADFVNYYGKSRTLPVISAFRINSGKDRVPPGFFRDKIVFVGRMTKLGGKLDMTETPFGMVFGVEVHATIADNLLKKNWIRRLDPSVETALVTFTGFLLALLICLLRPLPALGVLFGIWAVWAAAAWYAFQHCYYLPGLAAVLFTLPAAYASSMAHYYWLVSKSKEEMENVMGLQVMRGKRFTSFSRSPRPDSGTNSSL